MTIEERLRRAILRSEKAYALYVKDKLFFQALRIYKSNVVVYELLQDLVFTCDEDHLDEVFNYLYHLEDWFENFEFNKNKMIALDDKFVFENFKQSPPYPSSFVEKVLNQ